jgi:hypothetical protein
LFSLRKWLFHFISTEIFFFIFQKKSYYEGINLQQLGIGRISEESVEGKISMEFNSLTKVPLEAMRMK